MLLLIDNYDSFTYNLWHYFSEMRVTVDVARNDALTVAEAMARRPEAIIISRLPSHRPVVRHSRRARSAADARQAVRHEAHRHGHLQRHSQPLQGDALSLADARAHIQLARRSRDHVRDGRRHRHGHPAPQISNIRRAVPSREHRVRTRPHHDWQFPRRRRRSAAS